MIRDFITVILLRLLGRQSYEPLSENEVKSLLTQLANEEGLERLPDYLQQCADQYRSQYLYTGNPVFRGTVLAFVALREQVLKRRGKKASDPLDKKTLTDKEKNGTMTVPY